MSADGWFAPLVADAPDTVRVFHPDDVHLTVAFLGSCGLERAQAAWASLPDQLPPAFELELAGLVPMGSSRRPSALSLTLNRGHAAAVALLGSLRDRLCDAAGAKRDGRQPKPHITVARPLRKASASQRKQALAWAAAKPALGVSLRVDRIALYGWSADRRIQQFRIVAERELAAPELAACELGSASRLAHGLDEPVS